MAQHLLIVGGGFAGFWAAAAASALRDRAGASDALRITLLNRDDQLVIRPLLYQQNPASVTVPLAPLLETIGVELAIGEATGIDSAGHQVECTGLVGSIGYDAMVFALGSRLARPDVPGLSEFAHDVDSLPAARAFWRAVQDSTDGATIAVIGAGFTGLELVTEIAALRRFRPLLIDARADSAHLLSAEASDIVNKALAGTTVKMGCRVAAIAKQAIVLDSGETLHADLIAWSAGMRAHPLTSQLPCSTDRLGRAITDQQLHAGHDIFAAGDVAHVQADAGHVAPMSCQLAIPMGKCAGFNAAASLLGLPGQPFSYPNYVTCTDLGAYGALLTRGWQRSPVQTGAEAKATKAAIMRIIAPPDDRASLFAQALPDG